MVATNMAKSAAISTGLLRISKTNAARFCARKFEPMATKFSIGCAAPSLPAR